ncbi:MAG: pectate lyase, partial [Sphingobacteriaceae bacterium]
MPEHHIKRNYKIVVACLIGFVLFDANLFAQKKAEPVVPISLSKEGKLVYAPNEKGDRVPDFSFAGYKGGDEAIPTVPVQVIVPFKVGDATLRIQSAIDYVSGLPLDKNGFRGAVLLEKGAHSVNGALKIGASGVVLRGSGAGKDGTVILGAGFSRETLITVAGKNDKRLSEEVKVTDAYVPVNAFKLSVANAENFKVGDNIQIRRPSTKEWIDELGAAHFGGGETYLGWKPGQRDIFWDRKITAINGSVLTIDAPITTALDAVYGGGTVAKYNWPGRISNVGVENLQLQSAYNTANLKDEDHRWMAISFENVADAWVRQLEFRHFAGSAVFVQETAKRITV